MKNMLCLVANKKCALSWKTHFKGGITTNYHYKLNLFLTQMLPYPVQLPYPKTNYKCLFK